MEEQIEELKLKCVELTGRIKELEDQRNNAQNRAVLLVGALAKVQRQLEDLKKANG